MSIPEKIREIERRHSSDHARYSNAAALHRKATPIDRPMNLTPTPHEDRAELLSIVRQYQEALRPFANAAVDLHEDASDRDSIWESPAAIDIRAGDLRRAAALMEDDNAKV